MVNYDLRKLSEMTAPDRAFLTVCIARPGSVSELEKRFRQVRRVLKGGRAEKDEREYFDENVGLVKEYLEKNPLEEGALVIYACWALDFIQVIPLAKSVEDLVWIDSSPYIRPLAGFEEEYENVAVVVADNTKTRVFLVSAATAADAEVIKGNVKNSVSKGGWSQQRYERRRDKQLLLYAKEIVDALQELHRQEDFRRIVMVGSKETLREISENLPHSMRDIVAEKAVDLSKGDGYINEEIAELFAEQERQSEHDLWESIRTQYMRGGLGVVGVEDVLAAVKTGRVEKMIVNRDYEPKGVRCRECGNLAIEQVEACSACGSSSLYEVGVINEIVEMLEQTSAEVDFADRIDALAEAGEVAALLRY